METTKLPEALIPEGGESLIIEAGLLPLNRKPDSEESEKT